MPKPTWAAADDGWPYELFTFANSVVTLPVVVHGPTTGPVPEPGWHMPTSGLLDLIVAGCSMSTLAAFHVQRLRQSRH